MSVQIVRQEVLGVSICSYLICASPHPGVFDSKIFTLQVYSVTHVADVFVNLHLTQVACHFGMIYEKKRKGHSWHLIEEYLLLGHFYSESDSC